MLFIDLQEQEFIRMYPVSLHFHVTFSFFLLKFLDETQTYIYYNF